MTTGQDDFDDDFEDRETRQQRLDMFMAELAVLREQYGLEIGGCGECGSPWVYDVEDQQDLGWHLAWQGDKYIFKQGDTSGTTRRS